MSATNPNSPIKPVFKPPPDGGEVSWISNNSAIHGIGTKVHWNSKGIRNVCKTKDHSDLDASKGCYNVIPKFLLMVSGVSFKEFSKSNTELQLRMSLPTGQGSSSCAIYSYSWKSTFCLKITSEICVPAANMTERNEAFALTTGILQHATLSKTTDVSWV